MALHFSSLITGKIPTRTVLSGLSNAASATLRSKCCLTLAYIRVSDDKQDVKNQRHEILEAARLKQLTIDDFVSITMTSRKLTLESDVSMRLSLVCTRGTR